MSKATKRTPRRRKPQSQIERSEVRTGIYVRWTVRSGGDPRDVETVMREYSDRHNRCRRGWLSRVEQAAQSIVDAGDSPEPIAQDARQALGLCRAIRHWIEQGDAAGAAFEAFQLGLVVERIGIRPWEPHAARGAKVLAGARAGHEAVHGSPKQKKRRCRQYVEMWEKIRQAKPDLSVNGIDCAVAGHFGVNSKTIQRARLQENN